MADMQLFAVNPMSPITSIRVLRNIPLDNSYKDTLTFSSVSAQTSFFIARQKYAFSNMGPVRMQNKMRLNRKADDLYDCNYIMFQNANFSSKWFYAFITGIDFINVNMCEVSFEIDVMQTWYFDYNLKPSFVEREHVNSDTIGSNLVPENLELGEYVENGIGGMVYADLKLVTVVATSFDESGSWVPGEMYNKVYSGLQYYGYDTTTSAGVQSLNTFLESINTAGKTDGVVSIFMMPEKFFGTGAFPAELQITKPYDNVNGYKPKNKKLFTYPYIFLRVSAGQGNAATYHYEYFSANPFRLEYYGDKTPNPSVLMYPIGYKGNPINYVEGITLNGFPQCSFTNDAYKAYLAQSGASLAVSSISSATALVGGAVTLNPAVALGGAMGIASTLAQVYQHAIMPPQSQGNQSSTVDVALDNKNFFCTQISIRSEFAQIIDDYFEMYGYAIHRVKVPNITGRPSWNYVKTIDCKATGSIPFGDLAKVRSIYDSGITFWHGDYIGDYTRNNH